MEAVGDFWMLDSDVPPDPGATTSSIDFNMAHAPLQLLRVILIIYLMWTVSIIEVLSIP